MRWRRARRPPCEAAAPQKPSSLIGGRRRVACDLRNLREVLEPRLRCSAAQRRGLFTPKSSGDPYIWCHAAAMPNRGPAGAEYVVVGGVHLVGSEALVLPPIRRRSGLWAPLAH